MSIGALKRQTKNFLFNIINFNFARWHSYEHENWDLLDAVLSVYVSSGGLKGIWKNSTLYNVSDRVIDTDTNELWLAITPHTSAAAPTTFAADRAANPTYWRSITYDPQNRGQWTTATVYGINDFVFDSNRYGVAQNDYISGASYNADVAAGHIETLIDLSAIVPALQAADTSLQAADVSLDARLDIIEAALPNKSDVGHTHTTASITNFASAVLATEVALPRSYLTGLILANNVTDSVNDIDVSVGSCRDDSDTTNLKLTATVVKQIDVAFAEYVAPGTASGGRAAADNLTGSKWFHVFLIGGAGKNTQPFFATSLTPTLPTGFTIKRRIGSVLWTGTTIRQFRQTGDLFAWIQPVQDANGTLVGTAATLITLSVPSGVVVFPNVVSYFQKSATVVFGWIGAPNIGPANSNSTLGNFTHFSTAAAGTATTPMSTGDYLYTDTSSRVSVYCDTASTSLAIATLGWRDRRGRDD